MNEQIIKIDREINILKSVDIDAMRLEYESALRDLETEDKVISPSCKDKHFLKIVDGIKEGVNVIQFYVQGFNEKGYIPLKVRRLPSS